ncbi:MULTISPECIES: universal stress protein [Streptosporangium]|uniref:Nucleotide-binding universal stress UspA family protein n=1 Tax=Streptosporangium brasiliense TaxID=47480 RepID=A0ABT9R5Q1_9ACTN|nr:universal stress protein [Streptosporangium brasiliense]MDP9864570.1 nucleotide-binding universal stress UspA family protein [Streptosporangium brasiliense]
MALAIAEEQDKYGGEGHRGKQGEEVAMQTDDARPVVAGYDGSKASQQALRWAVNEARMRFIPLVVCHAWQWPYPMPPVSDEALEAVRLMGQHVLDMGVNLARGLAPRLEVQGRLVTGSSAVVLVGESSTADLVAVGPRGAGGFPELQLGSTAAQLAAHAYCPVAVVRESGRPAAGRVVVGVEGADPERSGLGMAFEEAKLRHAVLTAICLCPEDLDDTRQLATRFYSTVSVWEEKYPQVTVETMVETRPHTTVLHGAADHADLVVINDRGHDDPAELPLGPTAQSLLRGASCPVTVIPSRMFAMSSRSASRVPPG